MKEGEHRTVEADYIAASWYVVGNCDTVAVIRFVSAAAMCAAMNSGLRASNTYVACEFSPNVCYCHASHTTSTCETVVHHLRGVPM